MFKCLYCTRTRPSTVVSVPRTSRLFSCKKSLPDFNELCWSSLHRYTSLCREVPASPSSSFFPVMTMREHECEGPLHYCHLPFGSVTNKHPHLAPLPLTLRLRPPPKNWISFKEVWDEWEEYDSSIASALLLTFCKKKFEKFCCHGYHRQLLCSVQSFSSNLASHQQFVHLKDHYTPSYCGSANVAGQQWRRYIQFVLQKLEPVCNTQGIMEPLLTFCFGEVKISAIFRKKTLS